MTGVKLELMACNLQEVTNLLLEASRLARRYYREFQRMWRLYEAEENQRIEQERKAADLEAENAELRAGLVYYAVRCAELEGTVRRADEPDHDPTDCDCDTCAPDCQECGGKLQIVRPGKWQCPECE